MWFLRLAPLFVLAVPACAGLNGDSGIRALSGQDLLLGSSTEVVSLDAGTGAIRFQGAGVPALGSWSSVFSTSSSDAGSVLEARNAITGETLSSVEVPDGLDVRVASPDGGLVALMPPLPEGASPWIPEPRATTHIVIADPRTPGEVREFDLDGNFEPEAFSTDGRGLYMISYVPPTAPEAYRVARLEVLSGKVHEVSTGVKGVIETMSGTRLEQVAAPDGTMLHTLYTTAPAAYASHAHQHADAIVSFVHMLSLDDGWAHCLALPKAMWGGDAADQAMAVSQDGELLYVVDIAQGLIAEIDTNGPEILRTGQVDFGSASGAPTQATVTADGRLFVSTGARIVTIDTATLERTSELAMTAPVLALGADGSNVYVAMQGQIEVLGAGADESLGTVSTPSLTEISYVGLAEEISLGD